MRWLNLSTNYADSSKRRYISEEIEKIGKQNISAQIFTFRELCLATDNFNAEHLIGEGGFGRVYKGQIQGKDTVLSQSFHLSLSFVLPRVCHVSPEAFWIR